MKKNIKNSIKASALTVAILAMILPAFSYAATYAYVSQSGQVNTVVADTSASAIMNAPNISIHSGVMLVSASGGTGAVLGANTTTTTYGTKTYAYVNQSGVVITISADSSAMAFANAVNIDENSGIMLLNNTSGNN